MDSGKEEKMDNELLISAVELILKNATYYERREICQFFMNQVQF